jgi:hypothetical protein
MPIRLEGQRDRVCELKRRVAATRGALAAAGWGRPQSGAEFAGGQIGQGADAAVEFGIGEAALAIEPAEEVFGGLLAFVAIALEADRDQVAIGVAAGLGARDDMVQAADGDGKAAQAIKTVTALAQVDGHTEGFGLHEVEILDAGGASDSRWFGSIRGIEGGGADFIGHTDFDHVAGLIASEQAKGAMLNEAAYCEAYRGGGDASGAAERSNGEAQSELAFEAAVAEQMRIDGALENGEAETGNDQVFQLFPEAFGIGFVFHV